MRNPFKEFGANTDGPFTDAFPITPSDDNDLPETKIVDVFICKMRKKLPADFQITTHWGEGYSFHVQKQEAAA